MPPQPIYPTSFQSFTIPGNDCTPEVIFNCEALTFDFAGNSYSEWGAAWFYNPLLSWLENVYKWIEKQETDRSPFVFKFQINYIDSSSAKFLHKVIKVIEQIHTKIPCKVIWMYDAWDTETEMLGQDLQSVCSINIQIVRLQLQDESEISI
jgi:hypothetical protein